MITTQTRKIPDTSARLLARSPHRRRPMVMRQRWEDLLFLHWRLPPERVQQTLPEGLTVDTFEGEAYLGVTPFFMSNVRPVGLPALPWFSYFQELNVRTYVFDRDGTPGVWFYSLDCNRSWAALGARVLTGLSYFVAEMRAQRSEWIDYSWRRRGQSHSGQYRYRAAGEARDTEVDSLEFFLLERYYLFAQRGALLRGQVGHAPYRYHPAEVAEMSILPAELNGFRKLDRTPDHVCFVHGFDVNVFAQEKV